MSQMKVQDLARTLVKEYLYQNKLFKTYQMFQTQDDNCKNKLSKTLIIKSLCMEYLVSTNKKSETPLKSLLEILVSYLKNKYLSKKDEGSKEKETIMRVQSATSENFYIQSRQKQMKITKENQIKSSTNFRPSSARKISKPPTIEIAESQTKLSVKSIQDQLQANKQKQSIGNQQTSLSGSQKIHTVPKVHHQLVKTLSEGGNKDFEKAKQKVNQNEGAPKMINMFGKRRMNKNAEPEKVHSIFTSPVEQQIKQQKYIYEPMKFQPFIISQDIQTTLIYKKITATDKFKKKLKPIPQQLSFQVKKLMFQGHSKTLPKSWKQGILLSPFQNTFYGLQQIQGGPCGIVAALQCYFLKHLLYFSKENPQKLQTRQNCLIGAISEMLYFLNPKKIVLVIPNTINTNSKTPISIQDVDLLTITQPKDINQVYEAVYHHKSYYFGQNNSGYTLLLYSCILTKQLDNIKNQMDSPQTPLIGNHGHCNQQLVNMFITSKASTNIFDGINVFGEGNDKTVLKGIQQKSQFGFLTIFQTLQYIQAGSYLKNPTFPIWIICKQFHYHVVFARHYLISQNNKTEKFDLVYFDGLYNCGDKIIITFGAKSESTDKVSHLPLIQQVLMTKWGRRDTDWNGSIKIL